MRIFYELLFSPKPKFYLSYPITLLRDTPKEIEQIREIGEKLSRSFIVFDPLTIKDMALVTAGGDGSVPATMGEMDDGVIEQIKTRTISRDYQFVHQSDFVVVIYPTDKLSPGVLSEMNYATRITNRSMRSTLGRGASSLRTYVTGYLTLLKN